MGLIEKGLATVMLPLSIIIILEETDLYSLGLPYNLLSIGAILMIALQVISLIMLKVHSGEIGLMKIIMFIVFMLPVIAYALSSIIGSYFDNYIPLIFGVMMFVEAMYAFH